MLEAIINTLATPKDFYDLDFLLQANGCHEVEAKAICELIDSKGRTKLELRKLVGRIFNRCEATQEELKWLASELTHINLTVHLFEFDSKREYAEAFILQLKNEASTQ